MEKIIIPVLMGGQLEIETVEEEYAMPYVEIMYRIARQRNWIKVNKIQLELLVSTLQRALAEI